MAIRGKAATPKINNGGERDDKGTTSPYLLTLHQSVSGTNSSDNEYRKGNGDKAQSMNDSDKSLVNDSPSNDIDEMDGGNEDKRRNRGSAIISKIVFISALLFLWLSLMHSVILNNPTFERFAPSADGIAAAKLKVYSFVQEWSKHLPELSLLYKRIEPIPIEQFEKRVEVGQSLLRKYDDASGSTAACGNVVRAILDNRHRVTREDNARDLVHWISSTMAVLNEDENRVLLKALICMGEAKLALFSSPFGSLDIRNAHLMDAKDSFEAGVSSQM